MGGALGAIWGSVTQTVQTELGNVVHAATNAAQTGLQNVRTATGTAIQETGIGVGSAVAPPNTTPRAVGWAAQNWPWLLAVGAVAVALLARGHR